MIIDTQTAILFLGFGQLIFGFLLILYQRGQGPSQRIPYWAAAKIMQGIGSLLLCGRGSIPDFWSMAVANSCLLGGFAYECWAIFRITGRPVSRTLHLSCLAVIILMAAAFPFLSVTQRIIAASVVDTIFFALPGWAFLKQQGTRSALASYLGWSYLAIAAVFAGRMLWASLPSENPTIFTSSLVHQVLHVAVYYMLLAGGFGILLLARERADHELRASEARFRSYFELPLIGITITSPDKGWLDVNAKLCDLLGYTKDELLSMTWTDLTHPDDLAVDLAQFERVMAGEIERYNLEKRFICKDGHTVFTELALQCVRHPDRSVHYVVALLEDITERKRLEEQLQQQAAMDGLTGVVNRRRFIELATSEIKRAIRLDHPLGLSIMDLDHFKSINDTHGHTVGDQALIAVTRICQEHIRDIDVLARFGGDEFLVLFPEATPAQVQGIMERVRLALTAQPVDLKGQPVSLTISVGIAGLAGESMSLDALLEQADQALYQAKEAGRNRVVTLSP
ncbi:sensor domain-containing diguanylate cyclase [uncultured Thiodictyon sp.]|uniref:sensor domain-containing diguanylate cyclase n=1 Tax=uncultured Thiodictyon sp. TaxID=1846217 RepID=UPI0025DF1CA5|nr:sensor domain-containing diguanylate cyclase [uncultured Thiodictyon sp.]